MSEIRGMHPEFAAHKNDEIKEYQRLLQYVEGRIEDLEKQIRSHEDVLEKLRKSGTVHDRGVVSASLDTLKELHVLFCELAELFEDRLHVSSAELVDAAVEQTDGEPSPRTQEMIQLQQVILEKIVRLKKIQEESLYADAFEMVEMEVEYKDLLADIERMVTQLYVSRADRGVSSGLSIESEYEN